MTNMNINFEHISPPNMLNGSNPPALIKTNGLTAAKTVRCGQHGLESKVNLHLNLGLSHHTVELRHALILLS